MPTLKVVLLGDSSVGKSSLVNRFANDAFDAGLSNTIGAAFISREYNVNDRNVKFEIWDTAGQERYKSLTPMYYRNAKVALVCFDLSNPETSFERAQYWVNQLQLLGPAEIIVRIIGTKKDLLEGPSNLLDQECLTKVAQFCADHDLSLSKTSAKQGVGVTEIFNDIVDSLDEEFFREPDLDQDEQLQLENVLLRFNGHRSSCC